jgi:hypothetical protein
MNKGLRAQLLEVRSASGMVLLVEFRNWEYIKRTGRGFGTQKYENQSTLPVSTNEANQTK